MGSTISPVRTSRPLINARVSATPLIFALATNSRKAALASAAATIGMEADSPGATVVAAVVPAMDGGETTPGPGGGGDGLLTSLSAAMASPNDCGPACRETRASCAFWMAWPGMAARPLSAANGETGEGATALEPGTAGAFLKWVQPK